MKAFIQKLAVWLKVLIYFLIMWLATVIAGIVPALNGLFYFFAVSLLISWFLLRNDNLGLSSLGYYPQARRHWMQLLFGLILGCLMLIITAIITLALTKAEWYFNTRIDPIYILITFLMCTCSTYIREFVFRGYPFQALLKKYGAQVAQLAIVVPFGLMHVNRSMSLQDAGTVILTTGLGSILFGLAYIKTKNLMLPTGIHTGWNFLQALIPRTSGAGPKTLITVSGGQPGYGSATILLPYLVIVSIAILLLLFINVPGQRDTKK
ncbi:CPBP family intramembrane metalloprotease [Mucilaginibacter sp. S1162]|uniref:CPBP family intramembrane metalloprotease n=1 Tax=Mucilaginibacter humi TaxID=2732510 RepID=A0ABX1W1F3_9SPHI|nr:type II CAAX endopeptidase family protein [Mucilaginibacter humi]NNU34062.1 CPBP family intramembrane metalloprotease [Mucilaginibacter humi]